MSSSRRRGPIRRVLSIGCGVWVPAFAGTTWLFGRLGPSSGRADAMRRIGLSRRDLLKASAAIGAGVFATPLRAAAPEPSAITPALIDAARKEGKAVWYAAMDLPVAERMARGFEAKYPGIAVRIERTGSERQFQRLAQEYAANIHAADVIHASDASHFVVWKRDGWLAPFVPEEVARYFAPEHRDPDGCYATARVSVVSLGYNTDLATPEDAP